MFSLKCSFLELEKFQVAGINIHVGYNNNVFHFLQNIIHLCGPFLLLLPLSVTYRSSTCVFPIPTHVCVHWIRQQLWWLDGGNCLTTRRFFEPLFFFFISFKIRIRRVRNRRFSIFRPRDNFCSLRLCQQFKNDSNIELIRSSRLVEYARISVV